MERETAGRKEWWKKCGVLGGWGGGGRDGQKSCPAIPHAPLTPSEPLLDGPAHPSACPHLACPPGARSRWAWTAAPDQLNSQPAPGTRTASLAASQKSGGGSGGGRGE